MKKSDSQLQQDVQQELKYEPSISVSQIGVTAKDGIVGLTGNVQSYVEKYAAVHAAERVDGVKAVTDELKVDVPAFHIRNDEDIAKAAINELDWDVWIPAGRVKVTVENAWITLDGQVDYRYQQSEAENAVRNLTGVKGVSNMITVKQPTVSPSEVKANIEEALRRAAEIDADNIQVSVTKDRVILNGTVSSWAERREVERAAWSAPGVNEVVDYLDIAA